MVPVLAAHHPTGPRQTGDRTSPGNVVGAVREVKAGGWKGQHGPRTVSCHVATATVPLQRCRHEATLDSHAGAHL